MYRTDEGGQYLVSCRRKTAKLPAAATQMEAAVSTPIETAAEAADSGTADVEKPPVVESTTKDQAESMVVAGAADKRCL